MTDGINEIGQDERSLFDQCADALAGQFQHAQDCVNAIKPEHFEKLKKLHEKEVALLESCNAVNLKKIKEQEAEIASKQKVINSLREQRDSAYKDRDEWIRRHELQSLELDTVDYKYSATLCELNCLKRRTLPSRIKRIKKRIKRFFVRK